MVSGPVYLGVISAILLSNSLPAGFIRRASPMPEIKMPAANITETVFRLFVSGNSLQDAVKTAAAHVKNASADYCASHGIELSNLTINLQSALPEKNGYRLTYAITHRAT